VARSSKQQFASCHPLRPPSPGEGILTPEEAAQISQASSASEPISGLQNSYVQGVISQADYNQMMGASGI